MKFKAVVVSPWTHWKKRTNNAMCLHTYRMGEMDVAVVKTRLFSKICRLTVIYVFFFREFFEAISRFFLWVYLISCNSGRFQTAVPAITQFYRILKTRTSWRWYILENVGYIFIFLGLVSFTVFLKRYFIMCSGVKLLAAGCEFQALTFPTSYEWDCS